jgi:hypothetical protein
MNTNSPELDNVIEWAKTACEQERARVGWEPDEDTLVPSWLPELEAAIMDYENPRVFLGVPAGTLRKPN